MITKPTLTGSRTDDLVRVFVEMGGPSAGAILDDRLESTAWLVTLRDAGSVEATSADHGTSRPDTR